MSTYLSTILEARRAEAAQDHRDVDELIERALGTATPRPFTEALVAGPGGALRVIAEIKRRSPSKGELAPDLDPGDVAQRYAHGGAAAISVLTNGPFFGGAPEDLAAARGAVELPVLRKDFTVGPRDVCDARLMGADGVLLIVAALTDDELDQLLALARRLELGALVEVHDRHELERTLALGADLIGVNQRDLTTFEVDTRRALDLAGLMPSGTVAVAESGISSSDDARTLADAGYDAVLVGETLMRAGDRAAAVTELSGHPVGRRRSTSAR